MCWHRSLPASRRRCVGQAFQPDKSLDVRLESLTYVTKFDDNNEQPLFQSCAGRDMLAGCRRRTSQFHGRNSTCNVVSSSRPALLHSRLCRLPLSAQRPARHSFPVRANSSPTAAMILRAQAGAIATTIPRAVTSRTKISVGRAACRATVCGTKAASAARPTSCNASRRRPAASKAAPVRCCLPRRTPAFPVE